MKKFLLAFTGIFLVCAIVALKPKEVNVPPGHDSWGKLQPPDKIDPNWPTEQPYLTIENTSGCDQISLKFYLTANDENGITYTNSVTVDNNSNNVLTIGSIKNALRDYLDDKQIISIINLSLDVLIGGRSIGYFIYPYPPNNSTTRSVTGLSKPCDCLNVLFDKTNNRVVISRPVPPCAP